jgi:transposase
MSLNQETKTKNVWYFKGREPLIEAKRKGRSQSFYGALNLKTGKETAITVKRQNSKASIEFLKKLGETYAGKHILLLWDNASWHKSKLIKAFLKTTNQFTLMNFPPYAPEFNPQEQIWKALRQNVTHNRFEKDFDILIKDCLKYLNRSNFKSIKYESLFGRD